MDSWTHLQERWILKVRKSDYSCQALIKLHPECLFKEMYPYLTGSTTDWFLHKGVYLMICLLVGVWKNKRWFYWNIWTTFDFFLVLTNDNDINTFVLLTKPHTGCFQLCTIHFIILNTMQVSQIAHIFYWPIPSVCALYNNGQNWKKKVQVQMKTQTMACGDLDEEMIKGKPKLN